MDGHDARIESREGSQCGVHGGGGSRQCLRSTCISEVGESSLLGQRTVGIGHLILLIIVLGGALRCYVVVVVVCGFTFLVPFIMSPGGCNLKHMLGNCSPCVVGRRPAS